MIDEIVAFIFLQRASILKTIQSKGRRGILNVFGSSLRISIVIISHAYLFYFLGRAAKGISLADFFISGFAVWFAFSAGFKEFLVPAGPARFNNPVQTSVEVLVSGLVWELQKIFIALVAVTVLFYVIGDKRVSASLPHPDLLLEFFLIILAALLGTGFGLIFNAAGNRWHLFKSLREIIRWGVFVTSGLWGANTQLTTKARAFFELNPIYGILQYSRRAFDSGYSIDGANLLYPIALSTVLLAVGLAAQHRERKMARAT